MTLLDTLLSCVHENTITATFEPRNERPGTKLVVCVDCGARSQPDSSRAEWQVPEFLQAVKQERERVKRTHTACGSRCQVLGHVLTCYYEKHHGHEHRSGPWTWRTEEQLP